MIWHSTELKQVLKELEVDSEKGLANGVADLRLEKYGRNVITSVAKPTFKKHFLKQLNNRYAYILVVISFISFILNLVYDNDYTSYSNIFSPLLIIGIVIINAFISAFHLYISDNAMNHLRSITNPCAVVIRDGIEREIPSDELVPGDIVLLKAGDYITADARIISTDNLFRCNESIFTDEIIPVDKRENAIVEDIAPVHSRPNMVYSGCSVVNGNAKVVIVETGLNTEIGHTSAIVQQTGSEELPIKSVLDSTGKFTNIIVIATCVIAFIIGIIQNFNSTVPFASMTINVLVNTVALAIAAIPDTMPAISTVIMALGIKRIIKDGIILKKTHAIELLGRTSVICSDKTGIITHDHMTLSCVFDGENFIDKNDIPESDKARMAIRLAASCSTLENDSTEAAIEQACLQYNLLSKTDVENLYPRLNTIPFDSLRKTMTSINMINGQPYAIVKGAPEIVVPKCIDCDVQKILEANDQLANDSLRVVCIALKKLDNIPAIPQSEMVECDLVFVGLIGLIDPPRSATVEGIATCDTAGIKTIMITGDNLLTAKAVARRIGILKDGCFAMTGAELNEIDDNCLVQIIDKYTVFARITPEDKIRIIRALQKRGETVVITGGSTDDADALSAANIGCAMGSSGTDVAKGNADIIISNNNFISIVNAIKESRGLFYNIQKSVSYFLSCNFAELILYLAVLIIFKVPPLAATQLLLINLLTDCAPIFALCCDSAQPEVMRHKPITLSGALFDSTSLINIVLHSGFISVVTFISFIIGWQTSTVYGMTMAFTTLGIAEFLHSFNCKSQRSIFKLNIKLDSFMALSTIVSVFIILFLVLTPVGNVFGLALLSGKHLLYAILLSLAIVPSSEIIKLINRKKNNF